MNLHTIASTIALACIAITACGDPCLPTINADTLIVPPADDCKADTSGDVSSSSGASSGGGACEPPDLDGFICAAVPDVGMMWGPCADDLSCDDGAVCIIGPATGNVCAPQCDDCGCPGDKGCFGGTCNGDNACAPSCSLATDTCPAPGMVCDTESGACVWPTPSICSTLHGEVGGPCDNGTCKNGAGCIFTQTADICVPTCDAAGTACFATDVCFDNQNGANICNVIGGSLLCVHPCNDNSNCMLGQTCTVDGCLWPK